MSEACSPPALDSRIDREAWGHLHVAEEGTQGGLEVSFGFGHGGWRWRAGRRRTAVTEAGRKCRTGLVPLEGTACQVPGWSCPGAAGLGRKAQSGLQPGAPAEQSPPGGRSNGRLSCPAPSQAGESGSGIILLLSVRTETEIESSGEHTVYFPQNELNTRPKPPATEAQQHERLCSFPHPRRKLGRKE